MHFSLSLAILLHLITAFHVLSPSFQAVNRRLLKSTVSQPVTLMRDGGVEMAEERRSWRPEQRVSLGGRRAESACDAFPMLLALGASLRESQLSVCSLKLPYPKSHYYNTIAYMCYNAIVLLAGFHSQRDQLRGGLRNQSVAEDVRFLFKISRNSEGQSYVARRVIFASDGPLGQFSLSQTGSHKSREICRCRGRERLPAPKPRVPSQGRWDTLPWPRVRLGLFYCHCGKKFLLPAVLGYVDQLPRWHAGSWKSLLKYCACSAGALTSK